MNNLEEQVRIALIEKDTDEVVEFASGNPIYEKMLANTIKMHNDNVIEVTPENIRSLVYEQVVAQYIPADEIMAKGNLKLGMMKQLGGNPEIIDWFKDTMEYNIESARGYDKIVGKLTKIAEIKGVTLATERETVDAVTREIFPTKEEYVKFMQNRGKKGEELMKRMRSPVINDFITKTGHGEISLITPEIIENMKEANRVYLEKKLEDIYG